MPNFTVTNGTPFEVAFKTPGNSSTLLTLQPHHSGQIKDKAGQTIKAYDVASGQQVGQVKAKADGHAHLDLSAPKQKKIQAEEIVIKCTNPGPITVGLYDFAGNRLGGVYGAEEQSFFLYSESGQLGVQYNLVLARHLESGALLDAIFIDPVAKEQNWKLRFGRYGKQEKAKICFRNETPLHLDLEWLADDGTTDGRRHMEVLPHEISDRDANVYVSDQCLVRDKLTGAILTIFSIDEADFTLNFTEQYFREVLHKNFSIGKSTENEYSETGFSYVNKTPAAVRVSRLDANGHIEELGQILPGKEMNWLPFISGYYFVHSVNGGTWLELFTIGYTSYMKEGTPTPIEVKTIESEQPVTMTVRNDSEMELSLEWLNFEGKPRPERILRERERATISTFLSHPWILRDLHSGLVVDVHYVSEIKENWVFDTAYDVRPVLGGNPVKVRFVNCYHLPVTLLEILEDGGAKSITQIKPGEVYEQATKAGLPFEVSSNKPGQNRLAFREVFIPSGTANQEFYIRQPAQATGVAELRAVFQNQTNLPLEAFARMPDGLKSFGTIAPHDFLTRYCSQDTEWLFKLTDGGADQLMHKLTVRKAGLSQVTGNQMGKQISETAPKKDVLLKNDSPFNLRFFTMNEMGLPDIELYILDPGKISGTQRLKAGTGIVAKDAFSGHEIAQAMVPLNTGIYTFSVKVRSWNSAHQAKITFQNQTNLMAEVCWLDYNGDIIPMGTLAPGGAQRFETYFTHPWIVRDLHSKQLIERVFCSKKDQEVWISSLGIVPHRDDEAVSVALTNKSPFTVDVYEVLAGKPEKLIKIVPPNGTLNHDTHSTHPMRIREHQTRAEMDIYIPSSKENQDYVFEITDTLQGADTSIEFVNLSLFDLEVMTFDASGNQKVIADKPLNQRSKTKLDARVGQAFYLREKISHVVVAYTTAMLKPRAVEFSGEQLRSIQSQMTMNVDIKNQSPYHATLYWVDYDGKEIEKTTISPKTTYKLEGAHHSHYYILREKDSDALLDEFIVTEGVTEISMNTHLISKAKRKDGELWPGEVAVYTKENYQGQCYIFHTDLYDFVKESNDSLQVDLNDKIKSIRLGPRTAVTAYQHYRYNQGHEGDKDGDNDVYHLDMPSLEGTDVKGEMSSFKINRMTNEDLSGIKANSRLTEEPFQDLRKNAKGELKMRSVYRTTIELPVDVRMIEVYATESTTISCRDKQFKGVDPEKPAILKANRSGRVTITSEASDLRSTILMVRTNTMAKNERFFIFQDMDLHRKLANLEEDAFVKNRTDLGIKTDDKDQIRGVQMAMQNLAKAIPGVHAPGSQGQQKDLFVTPDAMQYDSWALDFGKEGSHGSSFRPISTKELKERKRTGETGLKRVDLDKQSGQLFGSITKPFKKAASMTISVASKAADTAKSGASFVAEKVVDTGKVVVDVGTTVAKEVKQTAESAVELGEDGFNIVKSTAEDGLEAALTLPSKAIDLTTDLAEDALAVGGTVLKATLDLGGEIVEFVIDTVDKVAECIAAIASKLVETVGKVIDFIKDLFAWDDILSTHRMLIKTFNNGIDRTLTHVLPTISTQVVGFIESVEDKILGSLDSLIDKFVPEDSNDKDDGFISEAMDKLNWLLDKLLGDDETEIDTPASTPLTNADRFNKLIDNLKANVKDLTKDIAAAFLAAIDTLMTAVTKGVDGIKYLIAGILQLIKALVTATLGVVKLVVKTLIDILILFLGELKTMANKSINIPFISDLYKLITKGEDLSLISLCSLLVAIPTTVVTKLVLGKAPASLIGSSGTASDEGLTSTSASVLKIAYACTHLVLTVPEMISDRTAALNSKIPSIAQKSTSSLDTIVTILTVLAQLTSVPNEKVKGAIEVSTGTDRQATQVQTYEQKFALDNLGGMIWSYQWLYVAVGVFGLNASAGNATIAPVLNTMTGIGHLGLQTLSIATGGEVSAAGVFNSLAAITTTIPPIGKVLGLDALLVPSSEVSGLVMLGLDLGHVAEGIAVIGSVIADS